MWWISSVTASALLLLLARWALRVAHPADDLAAVDSVIERAGEWVYNVWTILWRAYGPVTDDMRTRWENLRARYQEGRFGTEGT